jgi:hypothetical protein
MASLPVVPGVLKIQLGHALSTRSAGSKACFTYSGGSPTITQLDSIAAGVQSAWASHLAPLMTTQGGLGEVVVIDLASANQTTGVNETPVEGSRPGTPMPDNVACLVLHRIARRYRGGKPRSYFPFGVTSDIASGQTWSGTFTTAVASGWAAFIAAVLGLSAGSIALAANVSVSYYNGFTSVESPTTHRYRNVNTVRSSPIVDPIVSDVVAQTFGSQRRRLRG